MRIRSTVILYIADVYSYEHHFTFLFANYNADNLAKTRKTPEPTIGNDSRRAGEHTGLVIYYIVWIGS